MISCPTDFYSNTGDCNVEVGDYTGDYADVAARDTSAPETGHDNDGHFSPSLLADMDAPTDGIEDTTLNEPGLAARKLAKRMSAKPIFHICNDESKLYIYNFLHRFALLSLQARRYLFYLPI